MSEGYLINSKGKKIHREMMRPIILDALEELFPNKKWIVHHKDENKTNNDLLNLEVMTSSDHNFVHSHNRIRLKFPGATLQKQKNPERKCWKCEIKWNNRAKYIALFEDPLSASIVYKLIKSEFNRMR